MPDLDIHQRMHQVVLLYKYLDSLFLATYQDFKCAGVSAEEALSKLFDGFKYAEGKLRDIHEVRHPHPLVNRTTSYTDEFRESGAVEDLRPTDAPPTVRELLEDYLESREYDGFADRGECTCTAADGVCSQPAQCHPIVRDVCGNPSHVTAVVAEIVKQCLTAQDYGGLTNRTHMCCCSVKDIHQGITCIRAGCRAISAKEVRTAMNHTCAVNTHGKDLKEPTPHKERVVACSSVADALKIPGDGVAIQGSAAACNNTDEERPRCTCVADALGLSRGCFNPDDPFFTGIIDDSEQTADAFAEAVKGLDVVFDCVTLSSPGRVADMSNARNHLDAIKWAHLKAIEELEESKLAVLRTNDRLAKEIAELKTELSILKSAPQLNITTPQLAALQNQANIATCLMRAISCAEQHVKTQEQLELGRAFAQLHTVLGKCGRIR